MSWKSIDKLFNLDTAYLLVVFILLLLIYDEHNILDMLYLGLMTFITYVLRFTDLEEKIKYHLGDIFLL